MEALHTVKATNENIAVCCSDNGLRAGLEIFILTSIVFTARAEDEVINQTS